MLIDAIQRLNEKELLKALGPNADVIREHGTFYAGLSYGDQGSMVLGYGPDFDTALEAAVANHEG